ncbi:CDP-alcohol phosphatidyltransferase family protein [Desulfobulbus sp. TB]|nr:CDP-alcohol phosphatidyltransferase family protein [Desulfobulbus sp. TB]
MITVYKLKIAFQDQLRPLVRMLAEAGVTPNQVTIVALLLSVFFGLLLYFTDFSSWVLFCLPIILFVRMGLNAIDGMLAKEHDMQSSLGAILNELGDVISDTALYLPFAALPGIKPGLVASVVIAAIISEMTGVLAVQIRASRRYDGPMGKSDRAVIFGILGVIIGFGLVPGIWFDILMGILLLLCVFTMINRSRGALNESAG